VNFSCHRKYIHFCVANIESYIDAIRLGAADLASSSLCSCSCC